MTEVRIENLVKKYDGTVAIDGISLNVKDGEFVVLLGPSGCGKTTTLRCIAGLETADAGDIYIGEDRVNDLPPKDRDVAMVFQTYALYAHMSVSNNLAFPLKMRKMPKDEIENRVREVAKLLKIEHLLSRKPRQLSGGEQQRVAIARAIAGQPDILIMDEPTASLDGDTGHSLVGFVKRNILNDKRCILIVTHDNRIYEFATRILKMEDGRLTGIQMGGAA